MLSILAGVMIAVAGAVYLRVGGTAGAILFSVGLLTILHFKLNLYTGKVALLVKRKLDPMMLLGYGIGNVLGTGLGALIFNDLAEKANKITEIRIGGLWYENLLLGAICGLLMFAAVESFDKLPVLTIGCVAAFILAGANHCIADAFYLLCGGFSHEGLIALCWTAIGNSLGACGFCWIMERRKNEI